MDDNGYISPLKQQISKRWYYLSAHWLYGTVLLSNITYLIFDVLVVRYGIVVFTTRFKLW